MASLISSKHVFNLALGKALAVSILILSASVPLAATAQMNKAATEAVESYFEFIDYNGGTITAAQIPADDWKKFYVLDVRDAGQFAKDHISGAVNIEWRKVFAQRAKLPKDKTILVYCNTGSFSAQVAMSLRMDGLENAMVLHGGIEEWKRQGGFEANKRASTK
jgi:rhodanese-related sulfurtransferase